MSVQKTKLNWLIRSCIAGAACVSLNLHAGEATVWSDSAGDVVTDGAGDCLHTIWWKEGGSCANDDSVTHKHGDTQHEHEGGNQAHQHAEQTADAGAEDVNDSAANNNANNAGSDAESAAAVAAASAAAASAAIVEKPFSLSSAAAFQPSSAELSGEGKAEVKAFAEKLEGHEVNSITVEGYTDSRGSAAYNQSLSEQRANAVKDEMINNGIDASLITAIGHGERNPIADNDTSAGRAKNRRVIVSVDAKN